MALLKFTSKELRSGATSGTSGQSTGVTIPTQVSEMWVVAEKTAEANVDNVLTFRIQSQVGSSWFDLAWDDIVETVGLTTVAAGTVNTTRSANIVTSDTNPTFTHLVRYSDLPSQTLRVAWIASGTAPAHTFSVTALFQSGNISASDIL